jgi:hypothetical protein
MYVKCLIYDKHPVLVTFCEILKFTEAFMDPAGYAKIKQVCDRKSQGTLHGPFIYVA